MKSPCERKTRNDALLALRAHSRNGKRRMNLYLVRHGETDWNREGRAQGRADISLNDQGRAQSQALSAHLASTPITSIFSSTAKRARQTAEVIAAPHGLEATGHDDLLELDFGGLDGAPLREMRSLYPDFFEHWTRDPETAVFPDGGETLRALQDRAWALVESITRSHEPDANIILVSHAFAIYSMMCRALGMPLANYGRLRLGPGSVSLLVSRTANVIGSADEVQWALTSLNVMPPPVADGA